MKSCLWAGCYTLAASVTAVGVYDYVEFAGAVNVAIMRNHSTHLSLLGLIVERFSQ